MNATIRLATLAVACGVAAVSLAQQPTTRPAKQVTSRPATTRPPSSKPRKLPTDAELDAARQAAIRNAAQVTPATGPSPTGAPKIKPTSTRPAQARPRPTNVKPPAVSPSGAVGKPPPPTNKPAAATPTTQKSETVAAPANATTSAPAQLTTMFFVVAKPNPEAQTYRFDYRATPWPDVLSDFARMSGLSFLNVPDPPITDSLTFSSPKYFTYREALSQLNELLLSRPLNKYLISRQENFLTIERLPDLMRKIPPTRMFNSFDELERAKLDRFDLALVNFTVPEGWSPYEIIEEFRPDFSDTYGTQVRGDKIELTGLVEEHFRFRDVVNTKVRLSGPPETDPRPQITLDLKNVRAADAQTILRQLFPPSAPTAQTPGVDQKSAQAKRLDMIPDIKNNKLLIKGPQRLLDEVTKIVRQLDSGAGTAPPEMKVIKLQFADANMLTTTLKQIFMKEQQSLARPDAGFIPPDERASLEMDIFPDSPSNSVILVCGKKGLVRAEGLVKQWDVPSEAQVTEVIELKHADPVMLAGTMTTLMPQVQKPGQLADRITPRNASSLLVFASKQSFERIKSLIEKLDVPADDEAREHIVQLKAAVPSAVVNILQQAVAGLGKVATGRPGGQVQPTMPGGRFIPDDTTGFLIAYCSDKEWERAEALIRTIDEEALAGKPRLVKFELKRATAGDVCNMLRQMFPPTPGKGAPAGQSAFFADVHNNVVQVYGSAELIDKVTPLLVQLDVPTSAALTVIHLEHAKAEVIAPILSQSFGGAGPSATALSAVRAGGGNAPASAGGVRIVAEPVTNSLLVNASPRDMEQIRSLVAGMEAEAQKQADVRVIVTVVNRSATELAETIKGLSAGGAAPKGMPGGGASAGATATAKALNIVPAGRQIIFDGPQDQVAKAIQLFQQLDVPYEQPFFRKYAVQDAEEDERKLRALLAMSPTASTDQQAAGGGKGAAPKAPSQPLRLSAPDAVQIYPDTYENTLLVGVKVEEDFKIIENLLKLMFADGREIIEGQKFDDDPFFVVPLKFRKAFDITFTVEDIINPEGKATGVKLDEGPTERTLLVRNCKPGQKDKLLKLIEMFDVPEHLRKKNVRVLDPEKMPPEHVARLLARNLGASGKTVTLVDTGMFSRVQTIDIHADEKDDSPEKSPKSQVEPCAVPSCLIRGIISAAMMGQVSANKSTVLPDPAVCPICHQSPCALPGKLLSSLSQISVASFNDELEPDDVRAPSEEPKPQHNHPTPQVDSGSQAATSQPIQIMPDPETGKIIITGPEEDLDEVEEALAELVDSDSPTKYVVFPIKYADVMAAAQLLEQVFNQGQAGAAGRGGRPMPQPIPMMPQPQQAGQPGQPGQPGQQGKPPQQPQQVAMPAAPQRIKVIPDPRTRSLFVIAPASDIPLIVDVLKKIDAKFSTAATNIKIFWLVNLDATQVVENLREVLGLTGQGRGARGPQAAQQIAQQVTQQMLQMQGQQGQPGQQGQGPAATISSADNIKLTADDQTNSIIAQAPPDTLELIDTLIKQLEEQPNTTKPDMRRVPLEHARATDIATIVKDIAAQVVSGAAPAGGGSGGGGGGRRGGAGRVSVNADARTNSVILAGAAKDLDRVEKVIKDLDVDSGSGAIRQFAVKGDANAVANALKSLFVSGPQSDIVITAEASTGIILVKAAPPQMLEIEKQIKDMDQKVEGSAGLRSIALTLSDAETIAPKLQEIFGAAKGAAGGKQQITIKGNKSNQTLYVVGADEDTFDTIRKTAAGMDKAPTGIQVKSYQLLHASAVDIDAKLKTVMAQAMQTKGLGDMKLDLIGIVPDARTNSLIVTGGPFTFLLIGDVLKAVDVEASDDMKRDSIPYQLPPRVDVAAVVRNISELYMGPDAKASGMESPTVTGNPDTNVVTILASKSQHEQIVKAVIEPMMTSAAAGIPETRFISLKFARAEEATKSMTEAYKAKTLPNSKGQWPVTITADISSNNLIITAPSSYFDDIDAMLAAIDVKEKGAGARTEHTIALSNTSAADMASALQQIFTAAYQGRPAGSAPTIKEVPGTAKIIVLASTEDFEQIQSLVTKIDVGGRAVHAVTMPELVPVKTVADTIKQLYGGKPDSIKAEYHEPTNTLLVHATDEEFAKVKEQVIDVVSKSPTVGILQIYRIPLKYAVADEVAKTLQDFFDKKGGVSRNQVNLPPWMRSGGETAAKQMDNQVSITAEPTSNMLLVYCTDTTKKLIDEIIADIDTNEPPGGPNLMEMVELKYVDAEEMISILTEYLKVARRSPDESNKQPIPWWMDSREEKSEEKVVLAGDMRLKAIESMNAIILVGKPERVADCKKKIAELDVERAGGRDDPVQIALTNGNAIDIAAILDKVFNDPKRAEKSKAGSYYPPTIEAHDATNTLIVRAKTSDLNLIKKMAEGLDRQLEGETGGGVRVLPVTSNVDVEELANNIEKRMNDAENNRKQTQRDYKPSLVSIGADVRANALLVAGSKGKYEEVKLLVEQLMTLGPTGGTTRRVYKLKNLSSDEAKKFLEQIQSGPSKSGGAKSSRGPRSDADWIDQHRGHEPAAQRRIRPIFAMSMPLMTAQLFCASAIAQTPAESKQPVISTIRPATTQPARTRQLTPAELIQEKAKGPLDLSKFSEGAKEAWRRKLSGSPITIAEGGGDVLIFEGPEEDVEVITSILEMLDIVGPGKIVEYVPLKNAQAKNLAETLKKVFEPLEKRGKQEPRPEDKVDLIADPQTNGLYVAATEEKMAQVLELIRKNETAASESARNVKSFVFQNRRVMEVGEVLKKMIKTYLAQKGLDVNLIGIEIDPQTNTIFVTAGETDLKFVEQIIAGLDAELPPSTKDDKQPIGEADVMVVPLRIAQADALGVLLNELLKKAATGDTPMKDFIRRFRLLDEKGEPIATVNLDRPIVLFGEKDSNSLIIASTKSNCLIMKQVAMAFDKEPARAEVQQKIVRLKFADAMELAEQVTKFLKDSEGLTARPGKGDKSGVPDGAAGALVYAAVVTADPRTNQIMLVGRPEAVVILEDLINRLDVKGLDVMPFEFVKLEYASPSGLEEALTTLMKERAEALPKGTGANAGKAETVIVKGDPRSRSLIIAAKAARIEELKGLIAKLDIPATALIEDIRTITLKKASAGEMAEKLKKLWEERQKQQEGGSKGLKLEIPAIVADERSNSLVVAASKGDFDAIKGVVEKIEALELNPMANIYLLKLKYNSAKALAPAMTKLFEKRAEMRTVEGKSRPEDKVAIEVDEVGNSLLMVGSRENYEVLAQKVGELDVELGVPGQVEYFVCTNVGAARVKDTLEALFKDGVFKPGGVAGGDVGKDREKVTVTIDDRANMLIVSASPENMELVREIYKRMNSVATPWDAAITKLIIIEHGDAVKIAAQVKDHFEKLDKVRETSAGSDSKSKGAFGITIFADDRSNRIVLGGTKDGIDSAVELVKRLDVAPGQPGQVMEVYRLTEAPAAKIGEMIKKVFEERNKPRDGDTGPKVTNIAVSVETEESTNSLLINASREDHILVKDLVARLDRPSTLLDMVKVIPLEKAPAERVKEILEELYKSTGGKGGEGGEGKGVGVVEDKRTNSVIVTAPPGELKNIETLVRRLDETEVKGQAQVGVFICENEDAKKMSELLNQIMTGKGGPEGSSQGTGGSGGSTESKEGSRDISSMLISFAATDELGREMLLKTIRENLQITYSERTNSIIAVAPPSSLKLIEQLVRKLDQIQKRAVLVKAFMLRNADATKMVEILEQMFAQEEGKEDERAFQEGREISVEGGTSATSGVPQSASQTGMTQKGTFGRPKTTFVADERTNSLIVAGWPEDVDVVADVIDQLDSQPVQNRDGIVVSLVNAVAEDVQSALQEFFDAQTQQLDTLGESISPQRRMEQEVSVVAHPESNQLLLSVSPRYKAQVLSLIEQLDQPPPQVMIQVVIAEVTLDDRFEMGLEFALQELRFSETAIAGGNGVLQSSHFDVVGGTDLGAAGSGLGGFSFTLTGEDFNFLVRALQADSRLEVIQRPMIMCQDNQQASIIIGQSVPTPSGAQTFGGQTSTQVQYQQVGVILRVEPHINPDGFVYMLVEPEISSVTDSTIQIAPGAFAPIFNQRTASTNVAVKDGETVVIGGLITTTETQAESKVPLLGDIPGIGILFRTTTRTKNKSELLIAMTPRVVRTVEDARRLSIQERDRSGIITDEMKQSPLFEKLQVKPEDASEIDSIDTPPEVAPYDVPAIEQIRDDGSPEAPPAEPKKPYGPQVPRYGPMMPGAPDPVATRTLDSSRTSMTGAAR